MCQVQSAAPPLTLISELINTRKYKHKRIELPLHFRPQLSVYVNALVSVTIDFNFFFCYSNNIRTMSITLRTATVNVKTI